MLFYWILYQNKTSPFISCRSYCRYVHRSDGNHGERVNWGHVSVDTERESSVRSQRTLKYACFAKTTKLRKKKQPMSVILIADCHYSLQVVSAVSVLDLFPLLECRLVVLVAYCWSLLLLCCFLAYPEKPERPCFCCFFGLLVQGVRV